MSSFYQDYKILKSSHIEEFEKKMYKYIVEEEWEIFGSTFEFNDLICQQLVKYNDE